MSGRRIQRFAALITILAVALSVWALAGTSVRAQDPVPGAAAPDLAVLNRITDNGPFTAGVGSGYSYTIGVENLGDQDAPAGAVVNFNVSAGLTVNSAAGANWTCTTSSCTSTAPIGQATTSSIGVNVAVSSSAPPNVSLNATVVIGGDSNASNDSGSKSTVVNGTPDLTITKTLDPATPTLVHNNVARYILRVTNVGSTITTAPINVNDLSGNNLTITGAEGTGWNCPTITGPSAGCTYSSQINSGGTAPDLVITVLPNNLTGAPVAITGNTATVSGLGDTNPNNNEATPGGIVYPAIDLSIVKTADPGFVVGLGNKNIYLTVSNIAGATLGTITVGDNVPAGLTVVSATSPDFTCGFVGQNVSCSRTATMNPGQSFVITIAVTPTASGDISNTATVTTQYDSNSTNNTSTLVIPVEAVDVGITKSMTGTPAVGVTATYTLTITNEGDTTFSGFGATAGVGTITVNDTIPAEFVYVQGSVAYAGSGGFNCTTVPPNNTPPQTFQCTNTATLAPGQSGTISFGVRARTTGIGATNITNTATITVTGDATTGNNTATHTFPGPVATPDLVLSSAYTQTPNPFIVNDANSKFTFEVSNQSLSNATASGANPITLTVTFPAGVTTAALTGSTGASSIDFTAGTCGFTAPTLTCTVTAGAVTQANPETVEITFTTPITSASTLSVGATITGGFDPGNPGDAKAYILNLSAPDATINKSHTGSFPRDSVQKFTIQVTNVGAAAITQPPITVNDTLPAGLFFVLPETLATLPAGWSTSSANGATTVQFTFNQTLAASASTSFDFYVYVDPSTPLGSNSNTATVSTLQDTITANNSDTDTFTVTAQALPDLTVSQSCLPSTILVTTGTTTCTITVTNSGTVGTNPAANTITLTATFSSPGLVFDSAPPVTGWTQSVSSNVVQWTSDLNTVLAAAGSQVFTVVLDAGATPGNYTDVAAVALATPEQNTANNSSTANIVVQAAPASDLGVTMTHTGNFVTNSTGQYTIRVTNVSTVNYAGGTVTMTTNLPSPNLVFNSVVSATGWTCTPSAPNVQCVRNDALNASLSYPDIIISVTTGSTAGTYSAGASIVVLPADASSLNDNATDSTIVTAGAQPDLTVSETHVNPFTINQPGAFSITVQNIGSGATTQNATVTKTLPSGFTLTPGNSGGGFTCAGTTTATCTRTTAIPANSGPIVITLQVTPSAAGTFANTPVTVAVTSPDVDANPSNDTFTDPTQVIVNGQADLTVSKTEQPAGNFLLSAGTGTYRITVTNVGSGPTTGGVITVTDTLPGIMTYNSASGSFSCSGTSTVTCTSSQIIPVSGIVTFDLTVNLLNTGTVTNNVSVIGGGDTTAFNASDNTTVDAAPTPDLAISKTEQPAGNFQIANGTGTYRITVTNNGTGATDGSIITVTDVLPGGMTYNSATGGFSCSGSTTVTCTTSAVINASSALSFDLTVNLTGVTPGVYTNNVSVIGGGDNTAASGSDQTTVEQGPTPDLTVGKSGPASFTVGTQATYNITVTNISTVQSSGTVTLTDVLPPQLTYVSGSGTNGFVCTGLQIAGATVTCTTSNAFGASASATIALNVNPTSPSSGVVNTATVSGGGDGNPANNSGSTGAIPINGQPDLSITKTLTTGTSLKQNVNGSFNLTISNVGGAVTTSAITVVDTLPAGLTFVSATGGGFTCGAASQVVTCQRTTQMFGGDVAIITLTVTPTIQGFVTNQVTVSGGGDVNPANNNATLQVEVKQTQPCEPGTTAQWLLNPTTAPADGTTVVSLTVTIYQLDGQVAPNTTVTLQPSISTGLTITPSNPQVTNAQGQAIFSIKSTVAGTVTIPFSATNTCGGPVTYNSNPPSITFTAGSGTISATTSTVTTDYISIPADGVTKATVTVTLRDAQSKPVQGKTVTLTANPNPATTVITNLGTTVSDANGQVRFTVHSTAQGSGVFSASVADNPVVFITQTVTITFTAAGTKPVPAPNTTGTPGTGTPTTDPRYLNVPTGPIEGIVVAYRLRVRQGPGLDYPIIGLLKLSTRVSVLAKNLRGTWLQIQLETGTAWVSAYWIRMKRADYRRLPTVETGPGTAPLLPIPSPLIPTEGQGIGIINTYLLRVRTGPGLSYQQIGLIKLGTEVLLLGRSPDRAWYQIQIEGGTAWVSAYYIRVKSINGGSLPTIEPPPVP